MNRMELTFTKRRQEALNRLSRLVAAGQTDMPRRGLTEAAGPTAENPPPRHTRHSEPKG